MCVCSASEGDLTCRNEPSIIFRALSHLHKTRQRQNLVLQLPNIWKDLLETWQSTPSSLGEHLINIELEDCEGSKHDSTTGVCVCVCVPG